MLIAIICTLVFGLAVGFVIGREAGIKIMYDHIVEMSMDEDEDEDENYDEKGESE